MRLRTLVNWPRVIEPLSLLTVFLKAYLVMECQVEACRHVENRTTDVCIALPKGTHNPIYMVDLEEVIEVQFSDILKNSPIINVPLE